MKIKIILVLLFLSSSELMSRGITCMINAKSGLVLREKETIKSGKILTIPNGSIVDVINQIDLKKEKINNIDGYWIKVKYKNRSGYVFSGYLDLNYDKKQNTFTGILDCAIEGEDGRYLVLIVNGKTNIFKFYGDNTGIQFDDLSPVTSEFANNRKEKSKSKYYNKKMKVTVKNIIYYFEPGGCFEITRKIQRIELEK